MAALRLHPGFVVLFLAVALSAMVGCSAQVVVPVATSTPPVAPVTSVAPVAPITPVAPVAPVAPVVPVAPILPPSPPPIDAGSQLEQALASRPEISSFYKALVQSRILTRVKGDAAANRVTLFAPVNDAFAALDPVWRACFSKENGILDVLTQILLFHDVPGKNYSSAELSTVSQLTTALGLPLPISVVRGFIILDAGQNAVAIVNPNAITTYNATVHFISEVLIPSTAVGTIRSECYPRPPTPPSSASPPSSAAAISSYTAPLY